MNYPDGDQISEDLKKLRDDNSEIILAINPSTLWILIFQLQGGIRYLLTDKEFANETTKIVKAIQASLNGHPLYTDCLKQVLDYGWYCIDVENSTRDYFNSIQQENNN